jgi:hypothetical protein
MHRDGGLAKKANQSKSEECLKPEECSKSEECWEICVGRFYQGVSNKVSKRADGQEPDVFGSAYVKLDQRGNKGQW